MRLDQKEYKELQKALLSAFPGKGQLEQIVKFALNKNLENITPDENISTTVFKLIQYAESQGKLQELITEAYQENPENPELNAFYQKYQKYITTTELETSKAINDLNVDKSSTLDKSLTSKPFQQIFQLFLNGFSLRKLVISSLAVTGVLIGLRFFHLLESWELKTYDHLMQMRPLSEPEDGRLLIITITEEDIIAQDTGNEKGHQSSLRDTSLKRLLEILGKHKPRLIGLDLYRPYDADKDLKNLLQQKNIVGVCKVPETDDKSNNPKPEEIPPKEIKSIGFSDLITDEDDNILRRHLMVQDKVTGAECGTKESFSFLLTRLYLEQQLGKSFNYKDPIESGDNLQIRDVVFPYVQPFTGAYQNIDNAGFQVLLNYRVTNSGKVAKVVTLGEVLNNKVAEADIKDKIVLVGSSANKPQLFPVDEWSTPFGPVPGVVVHAQMVSQILSAVIDKRPLLKVLPQGIEMLWIWCWSLIGGVFACHWYSLKSLGVAIGSGFAVLYITCWASFTLALWIPLIPPALGLISTSTIIYIQRKKFIHR